MRFKTKKQQKEHVSGYGLWEDFNCFILRLSSINVTEKNILLKHATEKSNVRIISGKTKLAETDLSDKTFTLCAFLSWLAKIKPFLPVVPIIMNAILPNNTVCYVGEAITQKISVRFTGAAHTDIKQ